MSGGWDPTFELARDDELGDVEWGDEIPLDGSLVPGSDPAAMDAECMPFAEWLEAYDKLDIAYATIPAWELEN